MYKKVWNDIPNDRDIEEVLNKKEIFYLLRKYITFSRELSVDDLSTINQDGITVRQYINDSIILLEDAIYNRTKHRSIYE